MKIDDKTMQGLAASLKFREMRNEIISSNIANAETPDYKAKRVDFEDALSRALDVDGQQTLHTTDENHYNVGNGGFNNLQPEISEDPNGVVAENGNTVDMETEMARMAENKILYDATVQLINKKIGMMKYIINSER
jgi:flagellar basal-body rod protein FlgB